jgi:gamma-glutamyltranspeptidase/glutathione hydrolase
MARLTQLSLLLCLLAVVAIFPPVTSAQVTKTPTATGEYGATATVDLLATGAAQHILDGGGNAVDAAVAAAAVLGVTEPFSCGVGGGGFMVLYDAKTKRISTIDSRETSPRAMHPASFFENGKPLSFNDARYSGLSAGVPGTVAGWDTALRRFGTMKMSRVLAPAISVAKRGFTVDQTFFDQTLGNVAYFDDIPSTAAIYLDPDGTPRDVGSTLRNPDLAKTYERIARRGAKKGFYRGPVAQAIAKAVVIPPVAPTADKKWRPGFMTLNDLQRYTPRLRAPTVVDYRGHQVYSMGPPSSGGSTIGEALNILEAYDLKNADRVSFLHYFLEASRFSFADRGAYLADPSFFNVPLRGLLSDGFAAERRKLISGTAAKSPVPAGDPAPFNGGRSGAGANSATVTRAGTTTHLTTADARGNVVSYTFTIESTGGNGIVVPGYGFLLNNELTDFNFDSTTHPNRAEGGKRPRSSMAPTIVMKDGKPFLATGSPGGSTIITTVLQVLLDRIDQGRTLPEAIAAPRAAQRNTASVSAEPAFVSSAEAAALQQRGHTFANGGEIGAVTGIEFLPGGDVLAAAEPVRRGGGSALASKRPPVKPRRRPRK